MSDDRGDDLNFNELVGSLLSSHNADENREELGIGTKKPIASNDHENGEVELPEFGGGEEDDALAAVVANAIQNMDDEPGEVEEVNVPREENFEVGHGDEEQEDQQWAQILQQGILQGAAGRHDSSQQEEQLDPDDENLRRAILESLGELNVVDREVTEKDSATDTKSKSKKSTKKKKKKDKDHNKDKSTSTKKKKPHKKDKAGKDDLLDFDDVIKGFMRQGAEVPEAEESEEVGDAETQALVEATLKAFERELLSSQTAPFAAKPKTSSKKKSTAKTISTTAKDDDKGAAKAIATSAAESSNVVSEAPKKKKKKKKQSKGAEKSKDVYEEDEFSRALAEMVNEVVKTSLTDKTTEAPEIPEESIPTIPEPIATSPEDQIEQPVDADQGAQGEETFDLNQIMQKAMSMAFQEQTQENLDNVAMEEFNRGLRDLNVSEILTTGKQKKKSKSPRRKISTEKSRLAGTTDSSKKKITPKPAIPAEEALRKKYSQAATAAAAAARKRIAAKNKVSRLQMKSERKKAREERKLQKKQAKEQLELERKELELIVAKGPPYPPDLRLTKSGKPKKPYRRWTLEEMEKRASMPPGELQNVGKVKKPRKKKSKKLKKMPLSTLKKIPIFNFIRGNATTDVKNNLKDGDETVRELPLQTYHLDINKLAPPDTVSPEQWEKERRIKEEQVIVPKSNGSAQFAFDAARKTVVRREKIPLHPPWIIPSQVPFALPVARRRRKERLKEPKRAHRSLRERRKSREGRASFSSNVRAKIIPAVLLPIIKTLKAAARAKSASGASSEEASRHLVTIIRHTKRSIAQTLSMARRQSVRNYTAIKSESDLDKRPSEAGIKKAAKIPIFSLARIKQIDTSEDDSVKLQKANKFSPTVIKLEDEHSLEDFEKKTKKLSPEEQHITHKGQAIDRQDSAGAQETPQQVLSPDDSMIDETLREHSAADNHTSAEREYSQENETQPADEQEVSSTHMTFPENSKENHVESSHTDSRDDVPGIHQEMDKKESSDTKDDVSREKARRLAEEGHLDPAANETSTIHQTSNVESHPVESPSKHGRLSLLKTEVSEGASLDQSSLTFLKDTLDQSDLKGEQKVLDVLDSLVKDHLTNSDENSVGLPADVRNIISATIEELIPAIDEQETRIEDEPQPKRRKGPPPVLNLDGLVPPNSLHIIPKIEETPRPSVVKKASPKVKKPRKKAEQPVLLYAFDVPDFKNMQGRRTMLLKRAKNHLTNDEMNILKKEINKERKRKWRDANVEKNWENDLRARMKKRANAKFGENDSLEKGKWYQDEVNKSLAERGIKQEDIDKANDGNSDKKNIGSTNLSDNEVLNMIASTLNKLDVARLLEQELNEDAANFPENKINGKKKGVSSKEMSTATRSIEGVEHSNVMIPPYNEHESFHEEVINCNATEELDETGNAKRPYPDDIPVSVPLMKRPKALSTQEDK